MKLLEPCLPPISGTRGTRTNVLSNPLIVFSGNSSNSPVRWRRIGARSRFLRWNSGIVRALNRIVSRTWEPAGSRRIAFVIAVGVEANLFADWNQTREKRVIGVVSRRGLFVSTLREKKALRVYSPSSELRDESNRVK